MKKIIFGVLIGAIVFLGLFSAYFFIFLQEGSVVAPALQASVAPVVARENPQDKAQNTTPPPSVTAKSYLIGDLDSGFVFGEKNPNNALPVASLTKLMTALVVAERVDLQESIEITPEMLEAYGITEQLVEGKTFRAGELLYPFLIESSNDAAEALAGFLGREKTIRLMNEKAESLSMNQSSFVDPSGFDSRNVSTSEELFSLARYMVHEQPWLWSITRGEKIEGFDAFEFDTEELWDKNLFSPDPSLIGAKTGYIKQSKFTGVFLFRFLTEEQPSRRVVFILLGSQDGRRDTQRLYGWLTKNYSLSPDYVF